MPHEHWTLVVRARSGISLLASCYRCQNRWLNSPRKYRRPQDRKQEHGNSEDERDYTHPPLFELCRRIGEEKYRGEQNSIRQVLTGNTPGTPGVPTCFEEKGGRWCVQIGAFSEEEEAQKLKDRLDDIDKILVESYQHTVQCAADSRDKWNPTTRETAAGHALRDLIDRMFQSRPEELVLSMVRSRQLTPQQRQIRHVEGAQLPLDHRLAQRRRGRHICRARPQWPRLCRTAET